LVTARIGLLLDRQASELLAADMVVVSSAEFDPAYQRAAERQGLQVSSSVSLRTAIFVDDDPRLVELKAVDDAYPLRGRLERAQEVAGERYVISEIPARGELWVDTKLAQLVGQSLSLGETSFDTRWLLTFEPDRGGAIFNLAPRVLMNIEDLPATGLVVPGSRVRYRMMFAGEQGDIDRFKIWLTQNLKPGEEVQDLENARPEMRALYRQPRGAQGGDAARLRDFSEKPVPLLPQATRRFMDCSDYRRNRARLGDPVPAAVGTGWMVRQGPATGL
jgi:putative ABC transport system permease protein